MPSTAPQRPHNGRPARAGAPGRWCAGALLACALVGVGSPRAATAQHVRVRSVSLGRATHSFRADRTVAAPRIFTQGLSLWGYDLLGDQSGSLSLHVSMRYTNDFALGQQERLSPYFDPNWNALRLDLAYLRWRPMPALELRLGRQWSQGALGARDFDGLQLEVSPTLGTGVRARLRAWGGHDAQQAYQWFAPAAFDVMGLPVDDAAATDATDGWHWVAGAGAGMRLGRAGWLDLDWQRRWTTGLATQLEDLGQPGSSVVGSERVGIAASATIQQRLATSASASYHTLLNRVDHARAQVAWLLPNAAGDLSAGVEHRHPWFDSASIFNLFGARAYQAAFAGARYEVGALRTEFDLNAWGRYYPGSDDTTPYSAWRYSPADTRERALGATLGHTSRLTVWEHPLRWRTRVSWQGSLDQLSDQWLGELQAGVPLWSNGLFVTGRWLLLAARRDAEMAPLGLVRVGHTVPGDVFLGFASTGVVGVEWPVNDYATFNASAMTTSGTFYPVNTSVFASLRVEYWP